MKTNDEINALIYDTFGPGDRWLLVKRGLYYRPGGHGYTSSLAEAWILSEEEANQHVYPYDEPVIKQRLPMLPYATSADAVLPLLEKHAFRWEGGRAIGCQYGVVICGDGLFQNWGEYGWVRGIAPTFPLAACIALLRSKGIEV